MYAAFSNRWLGCRFSRPPLAVAANLALADSLATCVIGTSVAEIPSPKASMHLRGWPPVKVSVSKRNPIQRDPRRDHLQFKRAVAFCPDMVIWGPAIFCRYGTASFRSRLKSCRWHRASLSTGLIEVSGRRKG